MPSNDIRARVIAALKIATGEESDVSRRIADYAADFAAEYDGDEDGAIAALEQLASDLQGAIANLERG